MLIFILFFKYFIIISILNKTSSANDLSDIELEKRCDKREQLLEEKENEPVSNTKMHRNFVDSLLKRVKSGAESVRFTLIF